MNRMNRFLPLLLIFVLLTLGAVIYMATRSPSDTEAWQAPPAGQGPSAGDRRGRADSSNMQDDVLEQTRTLMQLQEGLKKDMEAVRNEGQKMRNQLGDLVTKSVAGQLGDKKSQLEALEKNLLKRFDDLSQSAKQQMETQPEDMPSGLGFDDLPIGGGPSGAEAPQPGLVSIKPMGASATPDKDAGSVGGFLNKTFESGGNNASGPAKKGHAKTEKTDLAVQKRYTINDAATLYENTTMTALLGRVPFGGKVTDPFRFKLITGGDNLAASGLNLPPNIKNVVWTGHSVGNRELSCVNGYLDTVTLVFEDGTISTTTVKQQTSKKSPANKYLGYIADRWGKPCIRGDLYSNASDYLKDRIFASALSAAGSAVADGETSTVRNTDGSTNTFFDGDAGNLILGRSFSGGMDEIVEYVRERMRDSFDVVYVPTGQSVTIHVESEIQFDYDPNGRKLIHDVQKTPVLATFD
ncbi:MAG: TIGR03752 family integrating conjugative element protein [Thiothrix sp.]|nr:MAG: TIGR03752 family integrating conjugative element protein [Thiothrix sp.]